MRFDQGAGNGRCAAEIMHFTMFSQIIKFAGPIITHREQIDIMGNHIFGFLIPRHFRDHQIDIGDRLKKFFALFVGEMGCLAFACVEFIRGQADDQIIAQAFGAFKKANMAEMQGIKRAVCQNFFQGEGSCYLGDRPVRAKSAQ